jgi:TPR repeat protein
LDKNMSAVDEEAADTTTCCASCGRAALDDVKKLKICTACKLVKYCSVDCQKNNRKQHKKACKKRAAEIRYDKLFTQPDESHLGECPICCLPLPLDYMKWAVNSCCCKRICDGCDYANKKREVEQGLELRCPYCREPVPNTDEEIDQNYMERAKANDPVALLKVGVNCQEEGDYEGAFQYYTKAAELGDMEAHYNLSCFYRDGTGVERDRKKQFHHLEEAAIGGHHKARYNLGCVENESGRCDRAVKQFIIAANLGHDNALDVVKTYFTKGLMSQEDYEAALRGHQAAVDATKSEQREKAYAFYSLPLEDQRRWLQSLGR